jgi:hypothetical protein
MREDNRRSITNHPVIKRFIEDMRRDGRCDQCLSIFGKGICTCGKINDDKEYREIQAFAKGLILDGWKS